MKFKRLIISLLAVLMLVSGCIIWKPNPVVKQFEQEEIDLLKTVLATHNDTRYRISARDLDPEIKVVQASSFTMPDVANKISSLNAIKKSHDSYLGEIPLGHTVYGPIVFDESAIYGEGDSLFVVSFIDGTNENFNVLECGNATLEKGKLELTIDVFIYDDEVAQIATPTFIVVEIQGCTADDIKTAKLIFDPHTDKGRYGRVVKRLGTTEIDMMAEMLEHHNDEFYSIKIEQSDSAVKAVKVSSFSMGNTDKLRKFTQLAASAQYHDDYTGKIPLTHPVYGPIVFDRSLIDPESEGVYFIICIDAPVINFGVTECLDVTLENGCLKVDLELLTTRGAAYAFITAYTVIEIEGCKAEDIESVMLEFVPQKPE